MRTVCCPTGSGDIDDVDHGSVDELPSLSDALPPCLLEPVVFASSGSDAPCKPNEPGGAERKLEQRRIIERRKYVKKQHRRRDLAAQVQELEGQLRQLMLTFSGVDPAEVELLRPTLDGARYERLDLERLLRVALRTKVLLREENAALRQRFMAATQHRLSLHHALNVEQTLCVSYANHYIILKPVTPEQCRKFQAEGEELVKTFFAQTIYTNSWVRTLHGWREIRALHLGMYNYMYQKTIKGYTAAELCTRSFRVFSEPHLIASFYSEEQNVSLRTLQKIDDDNVLLFEEMVLQDTDTELVLSKAIMRVSCLPTATGFRIHMQGLNIDELPVKCRYESEPSICPRPGQAVRELWLHRMQWAQFDTRGKDTLASYGGIIPTEGISTQYWVQDFVFDSLQWESMVRLSPFQVRIN